MFQKHLGFADITSNKPLSQESSFNLASISKQFVAMCIMMLEEKGKLQEYSTTLSDLEKRYDSAVKTIDDFQGGWKVSRMQIRHIRKEALKIALKENLVVLRQDMVSLNQMNRTLDDPEED